MIEHQTQLDLWSSMSTTKSLLFGFGRCIHTGISDQITHLFQITPKVEYLKGFVRVVTQDSLIKSPKTNSNYVG